MNAGAGMILKEFWIILIGVILFPSLVWATATYPFATFDAKSRGRVDESKVTLSNLGNETHVKVEVSEKYASYTEEYFLNEKGHTVRWTSKHPKSKTDYEGKREGNKIWIKGSFKGKKVNKTLLVDDAPFFFNVRFGLGEFAKSDAKEFFFWVIRPDTLEPYKMKANRKGLEKIQIGGKIMELMRVHWYVNDWRRIFFKKNYWFRLSDGLCVKAEVGKDQIVELIDFDGSSKP